MPQGGIAGGFSLFRLYAPSRMRACAFAGEACPARLRQFKIVKRSNPFNHFNHFNPLNHPSMQREALLSKAATHITHLINECKFERISLTVRLVTD